MRTLFFLLLFLLLSSDAIFAQTDKEAILKPINELFAGMKEGDSAKAHSAFGNNAILNTINKDKEGKSFVRTDQLKNFLKAIGTAHKDTWNEVIWEVNIQQDGDFAQVWANYAFYAGSSFSHCGVDAFQLLKGNSGWKIINLIDTRRKENCNIPNEISGKFK